MLGLSNLYQITHEARKQQAPIPQNILRRKSGERQRMEAGLASWRMSGMGERKPEDLALMTA